MIHDENEFLSLRGQLLTQTAMHEHRFSYYKCAIHQMWNDTFQDIPLQAVTLTVGTRNKSNVGKKLIHRRPFSKTAPANRMQHPTN